MILPFWVTVLSVAASAFAGVLWAGRFSGVTLPRWAAPLAAIVGLGLVLGLGRPTALGPMLWTCALVAPLTALGAIDAATRQLPDLLTVPLIALGLARMALTGGPVALAGGIAIGLFLLALMVDRFAPDAAIGAGDILLAGVALAWLGPAPLLELAIFATLLLWLQFLVRLARRGLGAGAADHGMPLAPAFSLALMALWLADLPPG